MTQPFVCDVCDERIHQNGPRWHIEYDHIAVTLGGFDSMPLDFCSRECLRKWATDGE